MQSDPITEEIRAIRRASRRNSTTMFRESLPMPGSVRRRMEGSTLTFPCDPFALTRPDKTMDIPRRAIPIQADSSPAELLKAVDLPRQSPRGIRRYCARDMPMGGEAPSIKFADISELDRLVEMIRSHGIAVTELSHLGGQSSNSRSYRFQKGIGNVSGSTWTHSNESYLTVGCDRLNPFLWWPDAKLTRRIIRILVAEGSCQLTPTPCTVSYATLCA